MARPDTYYHRNLVCSDLLTLSIDIQAVNVVINFDFSKNVGNLLAQNQSVWKGLELSKHVMFAASLSSVSSLIKSTVRPCNMFFAL